MNSILRTNELSWGDVCSAFMRLIWTNKNNHLTPTYGSVISLTLQRAMPYLL